MEEKTINPWVRQGLELGPPLLFFVRRRFVGRTLRLLEPRLQRMIDPVGRL